MIGQEDLARVLAVQKQGRANPLSNSNRLFGIILCDLNLITPLDNFLVLHKHRKLITMDQALVKRFKVSTKALALARKRSEGSQTPLLSVLLDQKTIPMAEIQKLTYDLYRIPFRLINEFQFNPLHKQELTTLIEQERALENGIIPMVKQKRVILFGMTDPSALLALDAIRQRFLHLRFKAVFIPLARFKILYNFLYTSPTLPEDLKSQSLGLNIAPTPGRMSDSTDRAMSREVSPRNNPAAFSQAKGLSAPRIITITSGKGGAGKTSISLNLAIELALANKRVCLFDADLGLANINILTGIQPENDLESVLLGTHTLDEVVIRNFQGIDIIPGSSGVERMADLTQREAAHLIDSFLNLDRYDYFIFDTSAGISDQVLGFCTASHEILMVITPEPTSLTDAYALLKLLSNRQYTNPVNVVVNQVKSLKTARNAYGQLKDTVNRFLKIELLALGMVVADRHVAMAVIAQTPFLTLFPDAGASKCIRKVAKKLMARNDGVPGSSLELFWHSCFDFIAENRSQRIQEKNKKARGEKLTKGLIDRTILPDNTSTVERTEIGKILQGMETKITALSDEIRILKRMLKKQTDHGG